MARTGYCPISGLCRDRESLLCCDRLFPILTGRIGLSCERVGVLGEACRDRPPWVLCRDIEFSIATELAHLVSRQGILVLRQSFRQLGFCVATQFWCCDSGAALWVWFCVAT